MDFETITYSVEDRVATIAVNRPDQLNAVSLRMKDELGQALAAAVTS
jgi:enoyl-CoA hydratase/carnithine racemase